MIVFKNPTFKETTTTIKIKKIKKKIKRGKEKRHLVDQSQIIRNRGKRSLNMNLYHYKKN